MKSLKEIANEAKKGDLLLVEGADENHTILLCEFGGIKIHHPTWNNIYEENWRQEGGDFGYIGIIGNPLEIKTNEIGHMTYNKNSFSFGFPGCLDNNPGVKGFELGKDSIINRLRELDLGLYAEAIRHGVLITSKNAEDAPRRFLRRKKPIIFKKEFDYFINSLKE